MTVSSGLRQTSSMIVAFFESIKYVGHIVPVAILRIFLGFHYLNESLAKSRGEFLDQPRLAAQIEEWLPTTGAPEFYRNFLENVVVLHWYPFAYLIVTIQLLVGISLVVGFLVRPFTILAIFLSLHYIYTTSPAEILLNKTLLGTNIMLCWLGAGRCLGFDYFFFKRHRGIWW